MKTTWQTVVLGAVFLVGSAIQLIPGPDWLRWVGGALMTLGGGGGFFSASRDNAKTRELVARVEGQVRSMQGPRL